MAPRIIHSKVSGKPAGTDPTRVYGSDWDADHVIQGLDIGVDVQPHDVTLDGLAAMDATAGLVVETAADTFTKRTLTGTANEVAVANGDGVSGNLTVSLPSAITTTGKTITGGTYTGLTITSSTFNGNTWTAGTGTLTLGAGKTATISNTLTFTGTDGSTAAFGAGGTVVYTSNNLSVFAATTSAQLRGILSDETGTGAAYFQGGDIGTPSAGVLTSATGLPISTGVAGLGTSVATFLATPSSANLRAALTDEVGTGAAYFVGGALGTPASGTATNLTGLPIAGITGLGTGVGTALAVNVGTAGAPVVNGGALGTPSSGTLTNATGLPLSGHTTQAAYTLVGNFTGSSAVPTASTISGLTNKATPTGSDRILIEDVAASSALKYATLTQALAAVTSGVSSIAGNTGAFTLSNGITNSANDIRLNVGQLPGEPSTGNASAGNIGEYVSSTVLVASAVSLVNNTAKDITSISLTAGDWDVNGIVVFNPNSSTTSTVNLAYINTTTNTLPTLPNGAGVNSRNTSTPVTGDFGSYATGTMRISIASTTTVYLGAYSSFAVSTNAAYGFIGARRAR